MNKIKVGDRFGRLIITEFLPIKTWQNRRINCICDCWKAHECFLFVLRIGNTKSCGCLRSELSTPHGCCKRWKVTKEYRAWQQMKVRCYKKTFRDYERYGGRGIKVCDRWVNSFENFFEDMGISKKWYSLDRIDNDGNYEPWNCRWADNYQQMKNRVNTIFLEYNWETLCLAEWSRKLWISRATLKDRIWKLWWSTEKALTTPVK